jgi:folate-dependent phosphoribosylglycinamide formyltransferase PurN
VSSSFVIVTTGDLPEAYFLAMFLLARSQRVAMVNVVARPLVEQLKVLARLRRNRGNAYLADLLLARLDHWLRGRVRRAPGQGAFPEVDAAFMRRLRTEHPHVDCTDPHADSVMDFVRKAEPDYMLLAGAQIIRPSLYELGRHGALNRHLGLLPEMRGSDCPIWAFALQQPECSGYSIHRVVQKVDAGDVLVRRPVAMAGETSLGDYLRRLQREASEAFTDVIDRILNGMPLASVPQNGGGRYFPPAGWSTRRRAEQVYNRLIARPLP